MKNRSCKNVIEATEVTASRGGPFQTDLSVENQGGGQNIDIYDAISDAMVTTDEYFRILHCNLAFSHLTELKKKDLPGECIFRIIRNKKWRQSLIAMKDNGIEKNVMEIEQGPPLDCFLRITSSRNGNYGYLFIIHDITSEIRTRKLTDGFLSIISHELRTPMQGIRGFLDILHDELEDRLNPSQVEYFKYIYLSFERLSDCITQLIDFSTILRENTCSGFDTIELLQLLEESIKSLELPARNKKINISLTRDTNSYFIQGAEKWIEQLFTHIIRNGIEFGRDNGDLKIDMKSGNGRVEITFFDDGIGIPAREMEKIFNNFYQVQEYSTRGHGGLGLGLPFTRQIIRLHGGNLKIESFPGKGTKVSIYLPKNYNNCQGETN